MNAQSDMAGQGAARADFCAIEERIAHEVAVACRTVLAASLRGVILTGSLARHEGSIIDTGCECNLLGDGDFLAVLHEGASDNNELAQAIITQSEERLAAAGIRAHISIGLIYPSFLRNLDASIFAYELRECGRVIEGDKYLLSLIPRFPASAILQENAFRMLGNRMIELLSSLSSSQSPSDSLSTEQSYGLIKLYLDMATSFLAFSGQYAPTYVDRVRNLKSMCGQQRCDSPFDLDSFSDHVEMCTNLKVHPGPAAFNLCHLAEALGFAQSLWEWELARLRPAQRGFARLVHGLDGVGCVSLSQWVRGWLCVLRHEGWHRSFRQWGRWGRLSLVSSPRYLVYAVASRVLFTLPDILRNNGLSFNANQWSGYLPLPPGEACCKNDWDALTMEIVHNYQELLVGTRS